jgi:hypothetical protein
MTTRSGPDAPGSGGGQPGPGLDAIMSERRQLINLTYRLLGSLTEAEDAVQETYARWYALSRQQREAIESPGAWLTTVASRVCLNLLGSARARRETYAGEWIPEPLPGTTEWINGRPGGAGVDPADRVTLDESVSMAFLVVTVFAFAITGDQIKHIWVVRNPEKLWTWTADRPRLPAQ